MLGPAHRLILEAAFLVALAVAAGLAELSSGQIIGVMALGWALTALVELVTWNVGARRTTRRQVSVVVAPDAVVPEPPAATGEPPAADPPVVETAERSDSADEPPVEPVRPPLAESPTGEAVEGGEPAPPPEEHESATAEPSSGDDERESAGQHPEASAAEGVDDADEAPAPRAATDAVSPPANSGEHEGRRRWFRRGQRPDGVEPPEQRPPPRHVRLIARQDEPEADTDEHVLIPPEQRAGEG